MNLDRPTPPDPYAQLPQVPSFGVVADFADGAMLPDAQVYAAGNTSPRLRWSGAPAGTKSYAVSCYDPDAPTPSGFWHWFVVNVPGSVTELAEGAGAAPGTALPEGASHLGNDFGTRDFGGAAPPPGDRAHRYMFAVTALDVERLDVEPDTAPAKASFLMLSHVIGRGIVTGMYAAS
ncbi:MAG: YbhB/YbcL family Raf kinase inhibitor-like protein [Dermatophilaceae bacterium]